MNVKFRPFSTPNFVIPEMPTSIPIRDVDAEELSELCDAFRADVFRKAGKEDPRKKGTP